MGPFKKNYFYSLSRRIMLITTIQARLPFNQQPTAAAIEKGYPDSNSGLLFILTRDGHSTSYATAATTAARLG